MNNNVIYSLSDVINKGNIEYNKNNLTGYKYGLIT